MDGVRPDALSLRKIGKQLETKTVWQLIMRVMALDAHEEADMHLLGVFRYFFRSVNVPISFIVGGGYLRSRAYMRARAGGLTSTVNPSSSELLIVSSTLCVVKCLMSREVSVDGPTG